MATTIEDAGWNTPGCGVHFCRSYRHPMELAYHAQLSAMEKREILSAWGAEANAIASAPMVRRDPKTGVEALSDEIADALRALDEEEARYARFRRAAASRLLGLRPACDNRKFVPRSNMAIAAARENLEWVATGFGVS